MIHRPNRSRKMLTALAVGQTVLLACGACAVNPARVTVPGTGVQGPTYTIHVQFDNALNLPAQAKVMVDGARAGQLERITVTDPTSNGPGYAVADIAVQQSISLPASTRVQLRQDTILGDIFIALDTTAQGDRSPLAPDATIPIARTQAALQIEDMITGLATFVSGGALRSAQHIVEQVNAALPQDPADTARIAAVLKNDLIDVSTDLAGVDGFLDAISANADAIRKNRDALAQLLTPTGAREITAIAQSLIHVIGVIGAVGDLAAALVWVEPLARAGNAAARAFIPLALADGRPLDLSAPSNLNRLEELLRTKLIPFFEHGPKLAVTGVRSESVDAPAIPADQQVDNMVATLRMIGLVK